MTRFAYSASLHSLVYARKQFVRKATLTGHEDWVRSLALTHQLHSDSTLSHTMLLASGSQDGVIRIWTFEKKQIDVSESYTEPKIRDSELQALQGHRPPASSKRLLFDVTSQANESDKPPIDLHAPLIPFQNSKFQR